MVVEIVKYTRWEALPIAFTHFNFKNYSIDGHHSLHNILEPLLGWPSKKELKRRILIEPLEPRLPKLHVSLKWKRTKISLQ